MYSKILVLVLFLCLGALEVQGAKRYRIDQVLIEAVVYPNGDMRVSETRTYDFQGSFSYAYRDFPEKEGVTFSDFQVREGDRVYPFSGEEEKGFAILLDKKRRQELGWAFEAQDEQRMFTVSYTVKNLIDRHEDVAVLYYKFIDKQWKVRQENVRIVIDFAGSVQMDAASEVRHWLHGPAHAFSEMQGGKVILESSHLTKNQFMEARILYPADWFPESPQLPGLVAGKIREEERKWAEEANAKRLAAQEREAFFERVYALAPYIAMGIFLVVLGLALIIYRAFHPDQERVDRSHTVVSRPPSNLHPAFINYLIYGYLVGKELTAVLYQLAYHKILTLEDRNQDGKNSQKNLYWLLNRERYRDMGRGLFPFERMVVEQIFQKISQGKDEVSFHEMQQSKHNWPGFLAKFNKEVTVEGRKLGIWNKESIKGMNWMIGLTIFLFLVFLVSLAFLKVWSLLLLPLLVLLIVLSVKIRERHPTYQREYYRWLSYRKYLQTALNRKSKERVDYELLNEHLIYGTVLGLTKSNIDKLLTEVPRGNFGHYLTWYIILHRNGSHSVAKNISQMAGNLAVTPMSSGGGVGGGASFGGGGGVSAGGGGAR